ncbi:MAG: tyrosine-type recombinase/integrase [Pikeienuella sp.]
MMKYIEENERVKRAYAIHRRAAKGRDESTIDKELAAIRRFEESTKFKSFKRFRIDQAIQFKKHLEKQSNKRTKQPLGATTIDAILRMVKAFFIWLVERPGYRRVISFSDAEYFNNTLKAARAAHAQREIPYPSMDQCAHAFQAMSTATEFNRRDKALFAFFMLTGCRDGAAASLKLKHVNVETGHIYLDGREVKTKGAKTFTTYFFPVGNAYRETFCEWVHWLRSDKLFGPGDALFPKAKIEAVNGQGFRCVGFHRAGYANSAKLNAIIKDTFASVQMPRYTAHSFRKTLTLLGDEKCDTREQFKAWSQNLGHDHVGTTVNSYLPVTSHRQAELIRGLA